MYVWVHIWVISWLSVWVHSCIFMTVHVFLCVWIYMQACDPIQAYTQVHVSMHVCTHLYVNPKYAHLCMYACVQVCIVFTCSSVCLHEVSTCMCVQLHMGLYICTFMLEQSCMYLWIYAHFIHMCRHGSVLCIWVFMCVYICVHVCIQVYLKWKHIFIPPCTHKHICAFRLKSVCTCVCLCIG